jgi:long-chain fatty acid transport protein
MKIRTIGALMCAGVAAFTLQSRPVDALLAGVKTTGMAATSVAYPIDAFAGVYNPAGITLLCDRLDSGISWVQTYQRGRVRDLPEYPTDVVQTPIFEPGIPPKFGSQGIQPSLLNQGYNGAKTADVYVPEFAVKKGWCLDLCRRQVEVSTGVIVHNRNDLKTTFGRAFDLFGTSPMGLEFLHQTAAFLVAARFCDMHSFGLSVNYNLQRLKVDGLEKFSSPAFSIHPKDTTNRGYNYSNGWGVILGYLFEWKCLKAGAAWHPRTKMKKFNKYRGFVAAEGNFDIPERFTAGISYRVIPCVTVAFDYEHIRWTGIPQLRNATFPNLDLGATQDIYKLGAARGPGFGFTNQSFYRFGAEYKINKCFTVRAGFRHSDTPVQSKFTPVNLLTLDLMEDVVTFGGTWRVSKCQELSFFYGLGLTKQLRGKNSIPATVPQPNGAGGRFNAPINAVVNDAGDSLVFPYERNNGEVDIKQRRVALGVSYGWFF